jgi:hypothetical protein
VPAAVVITHSLEDGQVTPVKPDPSAADFHELAAPPGAAETSTWSRRSIATHSDRDAQAIAVKTRCSILT